MKHRQAKIPPTGTPRLQETLQRLVQLYEATARPVQAAEWQQKLAEWKLWSTIIRAALQEGAAACRTNSWQEAARAFDQALEAQRFDWELAQVEIPKLPLWIGVAFLRAGLADHHAQLCRRLAADVEKSRDSAASAILAAEVCLLPAAASPELLLQASNILQFAESRVTETNGVGYHNLNWGLLHFRAGRYAEALESCREAADTPSLFCRQTALLLRSMAAKRLGRDREAEELWQAVKAQLPDLIKEGGTLKMPPSHVPSLPNLLVFNFLLDEAELLFAKEGGAPPVGRTSSRN